MISESDSSKQTVSVVLFEVEREQFCIDLLTAREIVPKGQIRRLPQTFDFVEGIYNYRGDIIYVINIAKKLKLSEFKTLKMKGIEEQDETGSNNYIMIVNINNINTGFLVDRILNISHIKANSIVGLSPIFETSISIEYIKGIVKFDDRPRILLDVEKVLTEAEQVQIQKELNK
ncbi:MAG: chemotaxis protein CheW [Promethearchaeota archaeon]